MADLITSQYATDMLALSGPLTAAQTTVLARLITAASEAIENYCNRRFARATVAEDCPVALDGTVLVRRPPINQVLAVRGTPTEVLTVRCTDAAATRASVRGTFTGDHATGRAWTGLELSRTASGVVTTSAPTFASNATLGALATAIGGTSGWAATVASGYTGWPSSDLALLEQARSAKGVGAGLVAFVDDLAYACDPGPGLIVVRSALGRSLDAFTGDRDDPTGTGAVVRVEYDGGYATIPADVQDACAEAVKATVMGLAVNPFISSEAAGDYSYTLDFRDKAMRLPENVRMALSPYRNLAT